MENSTDRRTQGRIKSPLARKAFFIRCIIFNFLSPILVRFIADINIKSGVFLISQYLFGFKLI